MYYFSTIRNNNMVHARTCEVGHFLLGVLNVFAVINSGFGCVIISYFVFCCGCFLIGLIWGQICMVIDLRNILSRLGGGV
jgi:hypothetical protein